MNFGNTLETLLKTADPDEKFALFESFYRAFTQGAIEITFEDDPIVFAEPSYAPLMRTVPLGGVRRGGSLKEPKNRALLLHSVAHIEYSAIDLALDAAYRFRDLPKDFYADWLAVADEEIAHFKMLRELLARAGVKYGDFEVHTGLFEAAKQTQTLIERMAVVPRTMEAGGLDANAQMRRKVESVADDAIMADFLGALDVILRDEIDHVRKGDRWFKYACLQAGLEPQQAYVQILSDRGEIKSKRQMNVEARLKAGFSCEELSVLAGQRVCG
ncbi:MAG: ferritin-like domain-containing protein [Campylobacterales bacterium]